MTIIKPARDTALFEPRSQGIPRSMSERAAAAFEDIRMSGMTDSRWDRESDILDETVDAIRKRKGIEIDTAALFATQTMGRSIHTTDRRKERLAVLEAIGKAVAQYPDELGDLPTTEAALFEAYKKRALAADTELRAQDAEDPSLSGAFAAFAGSVGGSMTDLGLLPTVILGAPHGATILRGMMIEAGAIAATEIPIQMQVQANRGDLGIEGAGFEAGALNVVSTALGGAGLYGLLRFGGEMMGKALGRVAERDLTPEEAQAWNQLRDIHDSVASTPLRNPTEAEIRLHQDRIDKALVDLEQGRAVNIAGFEAADLPPGLLRVGDIRARLIRPLADMGIDVDEMLPGLVDAMRSSSDFVDIAMAEETVDSIARRLERLQGTERAVNAKWQEAERQFADIMQARAAADERIAALENLVAGARERPDAYGESLFKDAVERELTGPAWLRKLDEAGYDTPEVRGALKRRLDAAKAERDALDTKVDEATTARRRAHDEVAAYEKSAGKAGRQLRERIANNFTPEEVDRLRRDARNVGLTAREAQAAEEAHQSMALAEALDADPKVLEGDLNTARIGVDELKMLSDEDRQAYRALFREIDEDAAMLPEAQACLAGVIDAAT